MFKLKLWSLSTFAIFYVLLASVTDRANKASAENKPLSSQEDLVIADAEIKSQDSQSKDFNWLWLGLPFGCGTLGGISYLVKRSQENNPKSTEDNSPHADRGKHRKKLKKRNLVRGDRGNN